MFCTNCGVQAQAAVSFCSNCGKPMAQPQVGASGQPAAGASGAPASYQAPQYQAPPTQYSQPPMLPPYQKKVSNSGVGFGVTSLIIGILTLSYAFIDFQGINSGDYGYIYFSEIGLLFMLSVVAIVFGSISARAENSIGKGGLGVSIFALLFTFYLAQFGG